MELDLSSTKEDEYLKKHLFNLKTNRSDGLMLQVYHSYNDSGGENKRYRFTHSAFNDFGTHLAVSDHKGHLFIIDLETEKYWSIPHVGIPTLVSFPVLRNHELLIGFESATILLVHIETGNITSTLNGHSAPPVDVSYSDDGYYYLTSCTVEAILWDLKAYTQVQKLLLKADATIKRALFLPVTNNILVCFQDDTMNIWKFGSYECIKQIVPENWKTHHLKAIAVTRNGRELVIGGHTSNLVIFCLDTWAIKKVVEFPEYISGIKQMEFVRQPFDGGANKVLALLTTSMEIFFFDTESSNFIYSMPQIFGTSAKISLSSNGKYLASILTTGEVNVFLIEKILSKRTSTCDLEGSQKIVSKSSSNFNSRINSNSSIRTQKSMESLNSIQRQLKYILDVKKLLPILKQFGEYPDAYRIVIWKTILQIPENQQSFVSLSVKKYHPSYSKLETKYPLVNKSLCNSLKKLLSNLSYWCPLFGEVDFLPEFVFPFVKLFHSDPLASFEVVATIIVNWGQNWFEFFPFPPVNMLSVMENILGYHDPNLLEFYLKNNITTSVSICPLFHTAFSEVLSKTEWLKLWDHILSNEPSFLFMAIIAYNVVCKNVIKMFHSAKELEEFFHKQNPVDMKMLISKTYRYLKDTPEDIHPRQFFLPFRPLGSGGTYTSFTNYPKLLIDSSLEKLNSIRQEEENILEEQFKALEIRSKLDEKLKSDDNVKKQEKIYNDLEEKIRKTVEEEEERILTQRQKLRNLRQELRIKELEVLEETRDKAMKKRLDRKKIELERLLEDISKQRAREQMEVGVIEEEVRKYYSELLLRKCELELGLGLYDNSDTAGSLDALRKKLKSDLLEFQNEWSSLQHNKRINFSNKMAAIKALVHDLETEVAKEISLKNSEKQSEENQAYVKQLKKKVKILENEIERILTENLDELQRQQEKTKSIKPRFQTQGTETSSSESEGLALEVHKKLTDSQDKFTTRNIESSKTHNTIKTISKKVSPGVKKITTIRTKVPKRKVRGVNKDKLQKCSKSKSDVLKDNNFKTITKSADTHFKSKFTCPSVRPPSTQDVLDDIYKTFEDCMNHSSSKKIPDCKKFKQEPSGDFVQKKKVGKNTKVSKGSIAKSIVNNDSVLVSSGSEKDIFESALRARWELIEEAKVRQKLEQIYISEVE